jgi:hypothetical protein
MERLEDSLLQVVLPLLAEVRHLESRLVGETATGVAGAAWATLVEHNTSRRPSLRRIPSAGTDDELTFTTLNFNDQIPFFLTLRYPLGGSFLSAWSRRIVFGGCWD